FAHVINLLDPDVIVVGGGLSALESIYVNVPALWRAHAYAGGRRTRLVRAAHGSASGVRGAGFFLAPSPRRAAPGKRAGNRAQRSIARPRAPGCGRAAPPPPRSGAPPRPPPGRPPAGRATPGRGASRARPRASARARRRRPPSAAAPPRSGPGRGRA